MKSWIRALGIWWVLGRHRLDQIIPASLLPLGIRILFRFVPSSWRTADDASLPVRLRLTLEHLGPVFIKFGQILSTRPDLIGVEYAKELSKLQDRVPPFPGEIAKDIIEQELKCSLDQAFSQFDLTPLASASIAQVHEAHLPSGEHVVMKVIRPNIAPRIKRDVDLMMLMAKLVHRFSVEGRRLRPIEVVEDYRNTIEDEIDLQKEAANASQLGRNWAGSPLLYVPKVYWSHSTSKVLCLEYVSGIPVTDMEALEARGMNIKKLSENGVEIFFTQVFRDSFFHADMHPGNILVSPDNPDNPQYISIDMGIIGTLTPEDLSYLARNLLAFFRQDYRSVARLHIDSGWVPSDTPLNVLEQAIRSVCEPIFQRPLSEISFGQLLMRLFQTARRFNMEIQPQLVLLQKTLLNIEGLGRQLYPDLDLWNTAQPFLENWMKERIGPTGLKRQITSEVPDFLEQAPILARDLLQLMNQHRIKEQQRLRQEKAPKPSKRLSQALQFTALGSLGAGIYLSIPNAAAYLSAVNPVGLSFIALGALLLLVKKS